MLVLVLKVLGGFNGSRKKTKKKKLNMLTVVLLSFLLLPLLLQYPPMTPIGSGAQPSSQSESGGNQSIISTTTTTQGPTTQPEVMFKVTISNITVPPFMSTNPTVASLLSSTRPSTSPPHLEVSTIGGGGGALIGSRNATKPLNSLNGTSDTNKITLRLGFLMANETQMMRLYYGFGQSAPAAQLAIEAAQEAGLIQGISFQYFWYICDCDPIEAVGGTNQLILSNHTDALFGPPCTAAALSSADVSTFYNVPQFIWGATSATSLAPTTTYPSVPLLTPVTYHSALAVRALLTQYAWNEVALLYLPDSEQATCAQTAFPSDFQNAIGVDSSVNITITFERQINATESSVKMALQALQNYARIVIACIDNNQDQRKFLVWADQLGMSTVDWVYIMPQISGIGMMIQSFTTNTLVMEWQNANVEGDDGFNAAALASCQRLLIVDVQEQNSTRIEEFNKDLLALQGSYPFYCAGDCLGTNETDKFVSTYAYTLYNAVYTYLIGVNVTLTRGGTLEDVRNGTLQGINVIGTWPGVAGPIFIANDGAMEPTFSVWGLDQSNTPTVYMTVQILDMFTNQYTVYLNYTNAATTIWATRKGVQPPYKPLCGYQGNQCPQSMLLYFLIGGGALLLVILLSGTAVGYAVFTKNKQLERMNQEVLIPWIELHKLDPIRKDDPITKSHYSMSSSHTGTGSTFSDGLQTRLAGANISIESNNHCFVVRERGLEQERQTYFAHKYPNRVRLIQEDLRRLRMIRQFDHDNLNKFIGVCIDGPLGLYALWKVCQRGSIWSAIESKNKYINDPFILTTLIKDLVNGLVGIHQSFLRAHGMLTSENCLISERWELKITDYGTDIFRLHQAPIKQKLLWTAPELLRSGDLAGTKEGDVYSFAMICSELVNNESVWGGIGDEQDIENTLRSIQNSSRTLPYRPRLEIREELNPILYQLIRDCWTERPDDRPSIEQIRSTLRSMLRNSEQNLMDYVLGMMEQYANSLEQEVEERTRELVEEKKKSDILLSRMLPRQVVEKLKAGESVEPEHFPSASVFFSDIVQFTTLASKCTPLQVVNILNSLYTGLDNIIETFDAYKVETIGDGYLIVSGVPRRNGDRHVEEIARLSFAFMRYMARFRVEHLPGERIQLRIGIHTGPVVAGVVGLAMPRYCLFGDTVNTASRMESSGKPSQIHISAATNHYLTNVIGGYRSESRGEVIIKGKGVMETFWLLGRLDDNAEISSMPLNHHDPVNGVIVVESPPSAQPLF